MNTEIPFKLTPYLQFEDVLPNAGKHIVAYQTDNSIIVYQAYKPSIANYAVANQKFGGNDFIFNRMTWIKPNFLWMMHRSGWAGKKNQERILAIKISRENWEEILSEAVVSSFKSDLYETQNDWKEALAQSKVRLQWDPSHDPFGEKLERKAIQIGIKGDLLKRFSKKMIEQITDITPYVLKQKIYVEHRQLQHLEIPDEKLYVPTRNDLNIGLTN